MPQNNSLQSPFDAIANDDQEGLLPGQQAVTRPSAMPEVKQARYVPVEDAEPPAPRAALPTRADVIKQAAAKGVDPSLALSIFGVESSGNFKSKDSPKGAVGGMQVMPGTFKMMMGSLDGQRDPWKNLEAGLRYIAYGQKTLGTTDPQLLAAGYHAGYDREDLKKGIIPNTSDGLMNTRDYARKVAGGAGKVVSDGGPGAPGRYVPMTDDEVKRYQSTEEVDLARFIPMSEDEVKAYQPEPRSQRNWGEVASDTGVQLAEGVNTIIGAVPNLIAPEGKTAQYFRGNADYWREQQSDPLKKKIAAADASISTAGEDGVMAQIAEAASQYFTDPALAARFVTTNLPSMIPGIGAAKLAQAAALARGASAARAAQIATTAAGGSNAVLNGGSARGEAYEDIKKTLVKQGMDPAQAELKAIADSRVVAAVGAAAGYVSGKTGLEHALTGKAATGAAVRRGFAAGATELAGEQLEELSPKLTTNYQASRYDDRSLGKDVGRTIVETAIGSGPGTVIAGGAAARNGGAAEAPQQTPEAVPATPEAAPAAPVQPQPQPAAPAAAPSGPLTASLDTASEQHADQGERVTVTAPTGEQASGTVVGYQEDEQGNFVAQIQGDDGQVHTLTSEDGVVVQPEAPQDSGPMTAAVAAAADAHADNPAPVPQAPAKPAQPDYASMELPALRDRLKYIAQQANASGDWNKMFIDARREVERVINAKTAEAKEASKPSEEPLSVGPFDQRAPANKMMLRYAEATGQPHEVVESSGKFTVQPFKEATDGARPDANVLRVPDERAAGAQAVAPVQPDQQAGREAAQEPDAGVQAAAAAPAPGAGTDVPAANGTADTQPALKDAHAGRWFSTSEKAQSYIGKKAAGDTHEVVQTGKVRFEVKPKAVEPVPPQVNHLEAANAKHARQDEEVRKATESIARRKAEKEAAPNTEIDAAANEAATSDANDLPHPTEAQIESGNYKKGHIALHGLDISVENPRGSTRSGKRPDGSTWQHTMSDHYGYVKRTTGADGEQVDVYVGPKPDSDRVYVVDQIDQKTGGFDEHKAMLAYLSRDEAVAAYKSNFDKGWKVGPVTELSVDEFKAWLKDGDTSKPAAEVKTRPGADARPEAVPSPTSETLRAGSSEEVIAESGRETKVRAAARPGNETSLRLNDRKVKARWEAIEADELEATIAKADNQYRDRTRAASQAQIGQIANAPAFDLLSDSPVMDYGAPTLTKDGKTIIGGNGRFAGLVRAYQQGTAGEYRAELEANADRFGVNVEGMRNPVLVRRFDEDVNVKEAAIASNEGGGLKMSALEQAKVDAERMGGMADFVVGDNGEIAGSANARFIRSFMGKMPQNQQASFVDADGKLSQEGIVRIRNAVLYRAYGDSPTLARMVESADPGLRNIVTAMLRVAPKIADAKARIADGDLHDLDISGELISAVEQLNKLREEGTTVDDYINQLGLFGDTVSDEVAAILRYMDANTRSAKAVAEFVGGYYDAVLAVGSPKQDSMFGADAVPTKQEIIDAKAKRQAATGKDQADIFADRQAGGETEGQPEGQGSAKAGDEQQQVTNDLPDNAVADEPPPAEEPQSKAGGKVAEAGEELTYNRRNRIRTGLKWSDVEGMNDALKAKETVKAKVWPKPDYDALIAGGMQPVVAHIVKQVYDSAAAKPNVRGAPTDTDFKRYIDGMNTLQSGVMGWANDNQAVAAWMSKIGDRASRMLGKQVALSSMVEVASKGLLDTVYPGGWRNSQNEVVALGGNKVLRALQPSTDEAVKALKEIEKGWPGKREAWEVQGYKVLPKSAFTVGTGVRGMPYVELGGRYHKSFDTKEQAETYIASQVAFTVLDKQNRIVGNGETEEQAIGVARELVKREGKGGPIEEGMNVADVERAGTDRRNGEDVTAQRLIDDFGFKGINFGKWVPDNERQLHLNHAFDSFHDLADVIGVPPQAMSLNGMLGIAFGAQGGGKALAHFVPGVNEINITRTNGAGSLAHEFAHALDHYFATQAGLSTTTDPFLTAHSRLPANTNVRPEIRDAFKRIVETMEKRQESKEEMEQRLSASRERAGKAVDSWLAAIRRDFKGHEDKFDAIAARIKAGELGDGMVKAGKSYLSPTVNELRDLYKEINKRTYSLDQITGLQSNVDHWKFVTDDTRASNKHEPQKVSTEYAKQAAALDKNKGGKGYWRTPWEMFARAFDAYVSDKLEAAAAKNTYLSHAGRNDKTTPAGAEREVISQAFVDLIQGIEVKDEGGKPVMYSVAAEAEPHRESVTDTPAFKRWFGNSKVVDEGGKPLVVYHGTAADFDAFDTSRIGAAGQGAYFSPDPRAAGNYAMMNGRERGGHLVPVYLSIDRPYEINGLEKTPTRKQLERRGYDGIIYRHGWNDGSTSVEYIAFRPEQIKSATGNNGGFDQANPDIRYSAAGNDPAAAITQLMQDKAGEATITRPDIGEITVPYGDGKAGLAHIARRRGTGFMKRLPELLAHGFVYQKPGQPDRMFIGNDSHEAVIRLDRDGQSEKWLLSAYEKHPDLTPVRQSRAERGQPFTKVSEAELKAAITTGPVGSVIARLIEHGTIVLHKSAKTLPRGAGKVPSGVQALTMPDGTMHLVAGALGKDNARAVLLHEMFHSGGEKLLGTAEWGTLMGRMGALYRQSEQSSGRARAFFDKARERVATAKAKGAVPTRMEVEEFAAYAIEEYERAPDSLPAAIRKWVEDLIGMVKAWMVKRYGKQLGQVTPAQLAAFAKLAVMDMAIERRGEMFGPIGELFSASGDKTIEVDGVRRPITNSKGQTIAPEFDQQAAFWKWFGGSKVVNEHGEPLVVYRGTTKDETLPPEVAYFADRPGEARHYARGEGGHIMPAYLRIENPMMMSGDEYWNVIHKGETAEKALAEKAKDNGHDGVIVTDMQDTGQKFRMYITLGVIGQIKSATANNGNFDASSPDIRYSVDDTDGSDHFATEAMIELTANDEVFRYPKAKSRSLRGVMSEIDPDIEYQGEVTAVDERSESGADRKFLLRTPAGQDFKVFERDNDVWLDVSRLDEGKGGSRIYAAVANFAHNTGKTFIGDPAGLSPLALRRRTDAMLSSGLKFGTTDHLAPHPRQLEGDKALGVPPLRWTDGDTIGNITNLIGVSLSSLSHHVPELANARYDFATRTFRDAEGKRLSDAAIRAWRVSARGSGAPGVGDATLKRAIVLGSLLRSESGERPGILEQILRQPDQHVDLKGVLYSLADTDARSDAGATDATDEPASLTPPEQGRLRRVQASIQDNMNRVKQVQERIMEATGRTALGRSDYYGAETNRPGRIAARLEDARDQLTGPLIAKLAKSGHTPEQLSELLHAMHANERNERVASINPDMPDGGSGMTDAQANEVIGKYKDAGKLHELANEARAIAKATLDLKLAYGLIKAEDHETLSTMYDHYVPLKGDGEYGPKVKRAMGHEEREEHILENIARDYDQAVVVGEKNLARQSLLQMVLQFKDDELWTARVPPRGRYVAGKVYNVKQGDKTLATFTSQSQVAAFLEGKGPASGNYSVVDSAGEQVAEFVKPLQDNEVMVYVKGDPVRIQIHDEALARQLRPLDQGQMHPILEFMRGTNRFLSKIYTGYNPAFILKNATRDAMTGTINMLGNSGAAVAAKAWAKYPAAVKTLAQWAATKRVPDGKTGRYLTEYRNHGGKVGASYMSDLEEQGKTLTRLYEDAYGAGNYLATGQKAKAAKVAGRKIVGGLAHTVEVLNQATENALRLSLFIALREEGVSAGKAAQAAKTVTVDFDRKGASTGALSAIYLFFNPAIQGTANAIKTLAKGEHKGQAWAALGGLALLGVYAASQGMGDDKDRWLGEEWETRTRNFILNVGGHQLRLPLSQEFAPVYALGVALAEGWNGESKMKSAARVVSSFIDAYFPLSVYKADSDNRMADLALGATPTVVKPLTEAAFNRNSFGNQIMPENELTKDRPDNLKMFRGTKNTVYDKTAQGIASVGEMMGAGKYENDITKVSPETLKSMWRTYTGGLGTFVTDSVGLAGMAISDPKQVEGGDVPIWKDFVRAKDVKPIRGRYYDLAREAEAAIAEFKQADKAGDDPAAKAILKDPAKGPLLSLAKELRKNREAMAAMADEKVSVNADPKLTGPEKRAKLKAIEQDEERLYRSAIEAFR